ncbi:hypothetical protein EPD60_04750 [Flaviaesturariibacter flavus]|uniref:Uncharacterized protein n=1 Tax=Flaviaesturariibacter flavus TaxID=2502780 RepID=A0A4R1BJK0_9BACT|nr:PGDYG domain-containing protein [Flaviaesturariibacter flavus]TCJ17503.1 hypothetical protein EPD60_04750 [Flaviaesturariibacter flavus]
MTQAEARALLLAAGPRHYRKQGHFRYKVADREEEVVSVIDGVEETRNRAFPGDYIVTGTRGERFVVKPESFRKRYRDKGNGIAEAAGECWAARYDGPSFEFDSPWQQGARIFCAPGDYLVAPDAEFSEVYRIEAAVFAETYVPVS